MDWNLVLDKQDGQNWRKNWCMAPVIADTEKDEVYFTPLYYLLPRFSKFMRPYVVSIACTIHDDNLVAAAAINVDGSTAWVILNTPEAALSVDIVITHRTAIFLPVHYKHWSFHHPHDNSKIH